MFIVCKYFIFNNMRCLNDLVIQICKRTYDIYQLPIDKKMHGDL